MAGAAKVTDAPAATSDSGPAAAMLVVERLEVVYARVITAVQGVSLVVPAGRIVALLGNNGAGKTTTMRAISGFLGVDDAQVTDGRVLFEGERIDGLPPHRIAARGIALVPERDKVFENLSVAENLHAAVTPSRARRRHLMQVVYEQFPRLAQLRGREAGYLSGGERQMLAIASALLCDPRLLLIDELSQGLAPVVVDDLIARLAGLRDQLGLTILLVEQNAQVALDVADHGYVIENGRVVLEGDAERLAGHSDVQEFYLGRGDAGDRRNYRAVKQYQRSRRWYG
jgi:branched-chain amino acid transport system ATP-binding protein